MNREYKLSLQNYKIYSFYLLFTREEKTRSDEKEEEWIEATYIYIQQAKCKSKSFRIAAAAYRWLLLKLCYSVKNYYENRFRHEFWFAMIARRINAA